MIFILLLCEDFLEKLNVKLFLKFAVLILIIKWKKMLIFIRRWCRWKSAMQTFIHVRWHEEKAIYESALWIYHIHAWKNDVWLSEKESTIQWSGKCQYASDKQPQEKAGLQKLYTGFFFLPRSTSELNIHFSCLFTPFLLLLLFFCQLTSCRVLWTNWILILQLKKWQIVL